MFWIIEEYHLFLSTIVMLSKRYIHIAIISNLTETGALTIAILKSVSGSAIGNTTRKFARRDDLNRNVKHHKP